MVHRVVFPSVSLRMRHAETPLVLMQQGSLSEAVVRILRRREVCKRVGLSFSSIYRLEKAGLFPCRLRLSTHAIGWNEASIDNWIESRVKVGCAGSDEGGATTDEPVR